MDKIKKIITDLFVTVLTYFFIYYLSYTVFQEYLFVWTADNKYCYIWIFSFLLIFMQKSVLSYCITFGNILGIFVGQYLGDFMHSIRMSKITEYTTAEERWRLSLHYGVLIWIIVIIFVFTIGFLYTRYKNNADSEKTVPEEFKKPQSP